MSLAYICNKEYKGAYNHSNSSTEETQVSEKIHMLQWCICLYNILKTINVKAIIQNPKTCKCKDLFQSVN